MQITVNGKPHQLQPSTTVEQLLSELQIERRYCAVERNQELVPRAQHADCQLTDGDALEIVTLVGGG